MRYSLFSTRPLFGILVNGVGYSADPKVTRFGPGKRNQTIIHYCLSGRGFYNGNPVTAGEGFLIAPGDEEEYHSDPADPWSFLWIILSGEGSDSVLTYYAAPGETKIFSFSYLRELERLVPQLIRQSEAKLSFGLDAAEMFVQILNLHLHSTAERQRKSSEEYAAFAKSYLELNYHRHVTVHELTEKAGVSQPYLYRVFKDAYGLSPKQYLSSLRLQNALEALRTTNLSVTEIGRQVGFDDVLTFSAFFSKAAGESPQNYRQRFR